MKLYAFFLEPIESSNIATYFLEEKKCDGKSHMNTPHAQHDRGKVIDVCGPKNLNRTLSIDSSFQTFAVGLLVEFIAP